MAINIKNVGTSDLLANYADSDDLSFIFVPEVLSRFKVSVPKDKWNEVGTLEDVAKMLEELTVKNNK